MEIARPSSRIEEIRPWTRIDSSPDDRQIQKQELQLDPWQAGNLRGGCPAVMEIARSSSHMEGIRALARIDSSPHNNRPFQELTTDPWQESNGLAQRIAPSEIDTTSFRVEETDYNSLLQKPGETWIKRRATLDRGKEITDSFRKLVDYGQSSLRKTRQGDISAKMKLSTAARMCARSPRDRNVTTSIRTGTKSILYYA